MTSSPTRPTRYEAVALGVSAGGLRALTALLPGLPAEFPVPLLIVQHLMADSGDYLWKSLDEKCAITVRQAVEKETPRPGTAYLAPPNYHLQVEPDRTLSLSVDPRVHYARPSIDVLFQTAAEAYCPRLIGVILTGANSDGTDGMRRIKELDGLTIVQDPGEAEAPFMPEAAMRATRIDHIARLGNMAELLTRLCMESQE